MKEEIIFLIYQLAEEKISKVREKLSIKLSFKIPSLVAIDANKGNGEKFKIIRSVKEFSINPDSVNRNRPLSLVNDIETKFIDGIHN